MFKTILKVNLKFFFEVFTLYFPEEHDNKVLPVFRQAHKQNMLLGLTTMLKVYSRELSLPAFLRNLRP